MSKTGIGIHPTCKK